MKKIMIFAVIVIGIMMMNSLEGVAEAKYIRVVAYYCLGDEGRCLTFEGNGSIWVVKPGSRRTTTIKVPAEATAVPVAPGDYQEIHKFFLYDPDDQNVGIGLLDGILHHSDDKPEFYYYELEQQSVITDFKK